MSNKNNNIEIQVKFISKLLRSGLMNLEPVNPGFQNEMVQELAAFRAGRFNTELNVNSIEANKIFEAVYDKHVVRNTKPIPVDMKKSAKLNKLRGELRKRQGKKPISKGVKGDKKEFDSFAKFLKELNAQPPRQSTQPKKPEPKKPEPKKPEPKKTEQKKPTKKQDTKPKKVKQYSSIIMTKQDLAKKIIQRALEQVRSRKKST